MHAQVISLETKLENMEETQSAQVVEIDVSSLPEADTVTPEKPAKREPNRERNRRIALMFLLPLFTFLLVLALWSFVQDKIAPELPTPSQTWEHAKDLLSDPFYDHGPNDLGIGWQLLYSLGRVGAGFGLAALIGIPLGFLMGMSINTQRALTPLVQILRPVSPLAWLPIGLLVFKAVNPSAIFVIFITCIWPMILNTATGVKAIPQDYLNVASVIKLSKLELAGRILFPATLPYIVTGMRLSLGVAWMVIVAAEMLTGGIGIGFWLWDEWNNLSVPSIIVAIAVIGITGIVLDGLMGLVQMRLDYTKR
jgi:nitrate/nitrite transport system permease protein